MGEIVGVTSAKYPSRVGSGVKVRGEDESDRGVTGMSLKLNRTGKSGI